MGDTGSSKWHGNPGVWQCLTAGLFSVAMFLAGFIRGQDSLANTVEINGNRITALETIVVTIAPTLSDIRIELRALNINLNAHITQETVK